MNATTEAHEDAEWERWLTARKAVQAARRAEFDGSRYADERSAAAAATEQALLDRSRVGRRGPYERRAA